jgi:hypothetical protein
LQGPWRKKQPPIDGSSSGRENMQLDELEADVDKMMVNYILYIHDTCANWTWDAARR